MSQRECTLCGLPVPDPPVTDDETEDVFCCEGCLHVHHLLQELDEDEARQLRQETIRRRKEEQKDGKIPADCTEEFLKVDGMHCATCESFIESMARRKQGIHKAEASYASELVKVYFDEEVIRREQLPGLISGMGYRAYPMNTDASGEESDTVARLIIGGFFTIVGLLIYILFLYPSYINGEGFIPLTAEEQRFFISNIFVMTSLVLFYTGYPILRGAWVSLSVLKPNMDLLISIAALSAYLFSAGALITGSSEVYFDVTMAIVMVVSLGNYYEGSIKRSKNALLMRLMDKRIKQARVLRDGEPSMVEVDDLNPGDQVLVKAGERIPVDGTVVEGRGVVNEALVTGESLPVSKECGDSVLSGTVLTQHALTIEIGEQVQSTVERMIRLMWNIQAYKPGKQRVADRIAAYFVPGVLLLGIITFIIRFWSGIPFTDSMLSALAVLIVSCPCALGLATPLAIASGLRDALKNNIIFKSASVFEEDGDVDILALDKTGTLTTGRMKLLDPGGSEQALRYAQAIERYSSHPLAEAIAGGPANDLPKAVDFQSYVTGVEGNVDGHLVRVGQPEWLQELGYKISESQQKQISDARFNGYVPTGVAWDGTVQSMLVVGDELRAGAESFVQSLNKQGKQVAVITGDSEEATRPLKEKVQPDYLFTGARPESKTEIIKKLKRFGSVAMVGDGSNDALALAESDLGIAFGDLTAIAAESAQVVIPGDRLDSITASFKAIRQTRRRIYQNLGWAFLYNLTTIPLAVAGLINPLFAALAMAASSLLVVSNSSRAMKLSD